MPDEFECEESTAVTPGIHHGDRELDPQSQQPAPRKKLSLQEIFDLCDQAGFPSDFMADREKHMPVERDFSWMDRLDNEPRDQ
jgi:hypothetical protein